MMQLELFSKDCLHVFFTRPSWPVVTIRKEALYNNRETIGCFSTNSGIWTHAYSYTSQSLKKFNDQPDGQIQILNYTENHGVTVYGKGRWNRAHIESQLMANVACENS